MVSDELNILATVMLTNSGVEIGVLLAAELLVRMKGQYILAASKH
jgi:hypothetical protein